MTKSEYVVIVFITMSSVLILAVAWWLQPDPRGFGTHQQLGLPPCTFQFLWGIPCPSCGMTTSFSSVIHGNFPQAFHANRAGFLLACSLILFIPWSIVSLTYGRFLGMKQPEQTFLVLVLSLLILSVLNWLTILCGFSG
jgi:hypothetical protein